MSLPDAHNLSCAPRRAHSYPQSPGTGLLIFPSGCCTFCEDKRFYSVCDTKFLHVSGINKRPLNEEKNEWVDARISLIIQYYME